MAAMSVIRRSCGAPPQEAPAAPRRLRADCDGASQALPATRASQLRRKCDGGFTLLELLVVMAIIAILATLSSLVWQRTQRTSKAAACMSNLRQLGTALVRYVGDNDGTFPTMALAREKKTDPEPALDTVLAPYLTDTRVFACPADDRKLWETSGTSYLWNWKLSGQKLAALRVSFVAKGIIDEASRIMVMGDKEGFHPHLTNNVNVLYADGHTSNELTFLDDTPSK